MSTFYFRLSTLLSVTFTDSNEFHFRRDHALSRIIKLRDGFAGLRPQRPARKLGARSLEFGGRLAIAVSVSLCRMFGMRNGEITIINWRDGPSFDLFHVVARENPVPTQGRKPFNRVKRHAWIAPRTAGVVNADRFVHFDLAVHRFGRRETDFPERDAEVGMQFSGDENLARIGQRILDRIYRMIRI